MSKKKKVVYTSPEEVIQARIRQCNNQLDVESFITKLIILAVFIVITFGVIFGIAPVQSNDMFPVLSAGDLVFYYRFASDFISGDVVVYKTEGEQYIGRVVAKGGDTVEITDSGQLKINDSTVIETDIYYATYAYDSDVTYPLTLDENEYFILVDYRDGGTDSRYFGAINESDIQGELITALRRAGL